MHLPALARLTPAGIAARAAIDLYQLVLRDPQPADWLTDPAESLAALCEPVVGPPNVWCSGTTMTS